MRRLTASFVILLPAACGLQAQTNTSKFRQLYQELPTPNMYRTGGGAPGAFYYQQQANYEIDVRLDDEEQRIYVEQTVS